MHTETEEFGPYRLDHLLGRGGMGEVYRAYDSEHHRTVAVKRLVGHLADDSEFEQRFRREAFNVARLRSPHVIPIHRYGEINGQLYIEMRYVEGGDLADLIHDKGPVSAVRAVVILEQLASALDEAHAAGLVHRDVKPSNVLLDAAVADFCYLADFGITRAATTRRSNSLTRTGAILGSLAYMAPEQFDGAVTPRSDIYSLTCLFFELLTGRKPYQGDRLPVLMHAHMNVPPPRPSALDPATALFDEVIATGMAKDAAARFDSAGALARAARAALNGHREADAARPGFVDPVPVAALTRSPHAETATDGPGPPPPPRAGTAATAPPARSRLVLPLAAAALVVAVVATIFALVAGHPVVTAGTPNGSTPVTTSAAQPVVADAVFTGRTSDNTLTLAVGVQGGRAAAYLCDDSRRLDAWLEGEVTGTHVVLRGRDPGTTIDATVAGDGLFGDITYAGEQLKFSAQAATGPGGLFQIRRTVGGIADRIGWIVLSDGTQVGVRNRDGVRTPAPPLDPATTTSQVDGEALHPDRVSGSTVVLGP